MKPPPPTNSGFANTVCGGCKRVEILNAMWQRWVEEVCEACQSESALVHSLNKQWTFEFPAPWDSPRSFLQAVEDLLGLATNTPKRRLRALCELA